MNPHKKLIDQAAIGEKVMEEISKQLDFDPEDAVFLTSTTEALQIVLTSLELTECDKILITSDCCKNIHKFARYYCDRVGCSFDSVHVPFPMTKISHILDILEEILIRSKYKLAIFEYISSKNGIVYPVILIITRSIY